MRRLMGLLAITVFCGAIFADDGPIWEANTVQLKRHQIGPGAFALIPHDAAEKGPKGVPIATTAGVVAGSRATLIVETGVNARVFQQIHDAATTVSDSPLAFAVNTSFHGDHSYGNHLLAPSVQLIQHENTKRYLDENFKDDVAFMLSLFKEGRGIEDARYRPADILVPAGGSVALNLGDRIVEIIDFGFGQTGGDLFVWDSRSSTLWAGNALIAEKPSLPWLLDGHAREVLETLKKVRAFLPAGATVVPGHGRPLGSDGFDWSIAYLEELTDSAAKAVRQGKTLEQYTAETTMAEYSEYALFDWVHFEVNLKAAYQQAKSSP